MLGGLRAAEPISQQEEAGAAVQQVTAG